VLYQDIHKPSSKIYEEVASIKLAKTGDVRSKIKVKGFSLVELSIALVIIALLATGVMGGTKILQTSRLSTVIKEISAIKTAVDIFDAQYKALPGDFSNANSIWSDCLSGDGNKDLYNVSDDAWEGVSSFGHMYYANILPKSPAPYATLSEMTNVCQEGTWYLSDGLNIAYHLDGLRRVSRDFTNAANAFGPDTTGDPKRSFIVIDGIQGDGNASIDFSTTALTGKQAFYIDNKIDDKIPNFGQVVSDRGANDGTSGCFSGAAYDVVTTTKKCTMFIRFR